MPFKMIDVAKRVGSYIKERFGILPTKSIIKTYDKQQWERFCSERHLAPFSEGVYLLREHSANLLLDSKFLLQNLFHEYFGHGLYIEHALKGQELCNLEQRLFEEEKGAGIRSYEELTRYREKSATYKTLMELQKENLAYYEGFAMWTEWYLSMLTETQALFAEKFEALSNSEKDVCIHLIDYSRTFGDYGLLYACGLPKYYNRGIIEEILKTVFKSEFSSIDFALVYGSRKPYSDIDIFLVSDSIPCLFFGWLDIYSVSRQLFSELVSKLDISVTDPLFSGELVCGNKAYIEDTKNKVLSAKITEEAIRFNKQHAERAKELASRCDAERERKSAMRYSKSYRLNAIELSKGRKPLTLKALERLYPEEFGT